MNFGNSIALMVIGFVTGLAALWIARHFFSAEARRERRRRRSNAPVTSKAKRPTVKFSVFTKRNRK